MQIHLGRSGRGTAITAAFSFGYLVAFWTPHVNAEAVETVSGSIAHELVDQLQEGYDQSDGNLLFVGPGLVTSDETQTMVTVLGQTAVVGFETNFPRGLVTPGEYVAVFGHLDPQGHAEAASIIRLGGNYSTGSSVIYLQGIVLSLTDTGIAQVGEARVDLAQAYGGDGMSVLKQDDIVEIMGFEVTRPDASSLLVATSARNAGDGSGVRGITGSGVRGITGSGVRGITGSGVRGITGSGVRGITGSGVRGITGSGVRGITGSGVRGITGSGVRGITGSGVRGITGSGVRGITGSGVRGITGSGVRGVSDSDSDSDSEG